MFSLTKARACLPNPRFPAARLAPRNHASSGSSPLAILPVSASAARRYLLRGGQACERLPALLSSAEAAAEWRASGERFCLFLFCLTLRLRLVLCSRSLPSRKTSQTRAGYTFTPGGFERVACLRVPPPSSTCSFSVNRQIPCARGWAWYGSAPARAASKRFSHPQSPRRTWRDKSWRGRQLCVPRLGRNYDSSTGWRRRSAPFR